MALQDEIYNAYWRGDLIPRPGFNLDTRELEEAVVYITGEPKWK